MTEINVCDQCVYCLRREIANHQGAPGNYTQRACEYFKPYLDYTRTLSCNRFKQQPPPDEP